MWDARTGTLLLDLKGHTDGVMSVSFSPDGTRIVTGSCGQDGEGVGRADGDSLCSNSKGTRDAVRSVRSARTDAHRHRQS